MFITFEGGEGSGKTTQIESLKNELETKGHQVITTREPGGTSLGEHIRNCLLNPDFGITFGYDAELMLFLASRVQHIDEVIRPALSKGIIVLCDRFNDSSIAYQGGGRGLGIDKAQQMCDLACNGFEPDLTFFLDINPDEGMSRLIHAKDRLEKEDIAFHNKVRRSFQHIAERNPHRVHIIDASQSRKTVFSQIIQTVDSVLPKRT